MKLYITIDSLQALNKWLEVPSAVKTNEENCLVVPNSGTELFPSGGSRLHTKDRTDTHSQRSPKWLLSVVYYL